MCVEGGGCIMCVEGGCIMWVEGGASLITVPHFPTLCSDVCTQANYQMMDSSFVGLIVSCFNQEGKHVGSPLMSHDIHVTLISYFLLYPLRSKKSRPLVSSQYIMELGWLPWQLWLTLCPLTAILFIQI